MKKIIIFALFASSLLLTGSVTYAHEGMSAKEHATIQQQIRKAHQEQEKNRQAEQKTQENAEKKVEKKTEKKPETKVKRCETRKEALLKTVAQISKRGDEQIKVFEQTTERVKNFYTAKGKILANYDALVADVTTKHDAAVAAMNALKEQQPAIDCASSSASEALKEYRTAHKAKNAALKEYRTSVKNLIVGVKSVQSTTTPKKGDQQ